MLLKKLFILLTIPFAALVGCDSNPTNAPSEAEIKKAEQDQIKAIDNDPTMSAQDKENFKRAKGLLPGGPPGSSGSEKR